MAHFRNRVAGILLTGAFVLSAGGAAVAQTAEAGLKAWVASIDASPDWAASFQSVATDSGGRVTTLTGLTISPEAKPEFRVSFDPIRVTGYSEPSGGGFNADEISAGGIRVEGPALNINLGAIKLSGMQVPSLAGVKFDKDKYFTSMIRLYTVIAKAKLNQATIDRVDVRQTVNGINSTFSYGSVSMGKLADGKIDSFVAGPMTFDSPSPEGLVKMSIERVESQRTDLLAMLKVYDPDQYVNGVGDGEWRQVVSFAGYRNLSIEAPGARILIASVSAEDFKVRQPPKPFTAFFDAVFANPNMPKDESKRLASEHVLNMLWSFGVGRIAIDGMDLTGTGVDRFRVGQFYLKNISADGLGEISLSDMRVAKSGEGSAELGRMVFGDFVFPKLSVIRAAIDASDRGREPDPLPLIPKLGFFEMSALNIDIVNQAKVALDRLRLDLGAFVGPIPTAIDYDMKGLAMDVSSLPDPEAKKTFRDLGYQRLAADYGFGLRWNEATETLSLSDFRINLKDMGRINADVKLAGLKRSALEKVSELEGAIQSLLFVSARISVEDDSLFNRVIRMRAKQTNVTEEELRQQVAGFTPFFLMMLRNPDFQTKLAPTLQAFIMAPGRLVMTAAPVNPVPLMSLIAAAQRNPERLPNLLSIDVVKGQ